jgi:very-short-patch-repair endonuclease
MMAIAQSDKRQISEARREQLREAGRRGGKARAAMADFRQHQSNAEVNDMAALGSLGAKSFIRKYGYCKFFNLARAWRLAHPSRPERAIMAILDRLGVRYEREAMVLGEDVPTSVDFYLPDCNDSVIEVLGRVHFDPRFDHPNKPETRRGMDLHRVRKLERAGFRVLEIDWRELERENTVAVKVAGFLLP